MILMVEVDTDWYGQSAELEVPTGTVKMSALPDGLGAVLMVNGTPAVMGKEACAEMGKSFLAAAIKSGWRP